MINKIVFDITNTIQKVSKNKTYRRVIVTSIISLTVIILVLGIL